MNKKDAIAKINTYGKIGKIITIIMIVFVSFSIVATIAGAISMKVIPQDLIDVNIGTQAEVTINPSAIDAGVNASELQVVVDAINNGDINGGLNLGAIRMTLETAEIVGNKVICRTNGNIGNISLSTIGDTLFLALFALVLTLTSVVFGMLLCKSIEKCESPFDEKVIKSMRCFAFSLLPWAVISSVSDYVVNRIFGNSLQISVSFDMGIIFTVLIILALTIVFKYGAILQQESDETL